MADLFCDGNISYPINGGGAWRCHKCGMMGFGDDHRHLAKLTPLGELMVQFAHYIDRRMLAGAPLELIVIELLAFIGPGVAAVHDRAS